MQEDKNFQGVVCCCLDTENRPVLDSIDKLLDLKTTTTHKGVTCLILELKNKYYKAKIQLFDYNNLPAEDKEKKDILDNSHAIILLADGYKLTTDKLDEMVTLLSNVGGEPRILLCDGTEEDCNSLRSIREWCIFNGFSLIGNKDVNARTEIIETLSAYRWIHRSNEVDSENKPQLNDETIRKLEDFDSLLRKLSTYRDKPELRGNPDDKNIVEIAEILSGLLGDDVDKFLDNEEVNSNQES